MCRTFLDPTGWHPLLVLSKTVTKRNVTKAMSYGALLAEVLG